MKEINFNITKTDVKVGNKTLRKPDNTERKPNKLSDEYFTTHMSEFRRFNKIGFTSLDVLPELNGKVWNDYALGLVHSLRPSSIRVTDSETKLDARTWRVTVYINNKTDRIIERIRQEVEVGLPDDIDGASRALMAAINDGVESDIFKWNNMNGQEMWTPCGGYKEDKNGIWIPHPNNSKSMDDDDIIKMMDSELEIDGQKPIE